MNNNLIFEGKKYISSRRASDISGYSSDYIGQLCRAEKIDCRMVGRSWYVTEESLLSHKKNVAIAESSPQRIQNIRGVKISYPIFNVIEQKSVSEPKAEQSTIPEPLVVKDEKKGIPSFIYTEDERPLLPILEKYSSPKQIEKKVDITPAKKVSIAPEIIPVREISPIREVGLARTPVKVSSIPSLSRTIILRRALATSMVALTLVTGIFIYTVPSYQISDQSLASIGSIVDSLKSSFNSVIDFISLAFNKEESKDIATKDISETVELQNSWNGIAVIPSSDSMENELIKQRIQASFSDEVRIEIDESGTAGVITPIFKNASSKDFVYVLVPVDDAKSGN